MTGATSSLKKHTVAKQIQVSIFPTKHFASQADGKSPLKIIGEIHIGLRRGDIQLRLEALVVEDLDADILACMPFMRQNNIILDIPNDAIRIGIQVIKYYFSKTSVRSATVRHTDSFLLRASSPNVLHPAFLELSVPPDLNDSNVSLEPRCDSIVSTWPSPHIIKVIAGKVCIPNESDSIISIKKNQHIAQVRHILDEDILPFDVNISQIADTYVSKLDEPFFQSIQINPIKQLQLRDHQSFDALHSQYDSVFDYKIGKYNGASGNIKASINMGPVEPHLKKGGYPCTRERTLMNYRIRWTN
ncbi:hypothetical protein LOTGIDRAFT_171399 [Lottia gigantea]|uniref:Uncharacterized protein n=1 Tax=Lottia gigantea TaxID=225164 RepID=V4BBN5_LOTGI|nr:hypothetical protein LOTGIDRAFT_171399 [Lottia gigantea]ESP03462.1 hypothetical protein LOTGIDRAFT_171399 [Lottia gigantea]